MLGTCQSGGPRQDWGGPEQQEAAGSMPTLAPRWPHAGPTLTGHRSHPQGSAGVWSPRGDFPRWVLVWSP